MIWPQARHFDLLHGGYKAGFEYACTKLLDSKSNKANSEEEELVDVALSRGPALSKHDTAAEAVLATAVRWKDAALWIRAVTEVLKNRDFALSFTDEQILQAAKRCGFRKIQAWYVFLDYWTVVSDRIDSPPSLEKALNDNPNNIDIIRVLDRLQERVGDKHDKVAHKTLTKTWIVGQRKKRFESLETPLVEEHAGLTSSAIAHGGLKFLEET